MNADKQTLRSYLRSSAFISGYLLPCRHEGAEAAGPFGGAKLAKRFGFNLANSFARDVEFLADLFECVLALAADAEAHADHFLLLGREGFEDAGGFIADVGLDHCVDGGTHPTIFDEIAEGGLAVAADWGFERDRIAGDGLELLDFLHRDIHPAANFVICRSTAQFLLQFARRPEELVHAFVHVNRDTDGAGLVGDGAGDGLADPPGGVGRKLVTAAVFELVGGAHEADIALLNEVQEMKSAVYVFLGDGDHQAEVGLDQILFGALGLGFAMTDYGHAVLEFGQGGAGGGLALLDLLLQFLQAECLSGVGAHLEALDFAIEMAVFIHRAFDFAGKL